MQKGEGDYRAGEAVSPYLKIIPASLAALLVYFGNYSDVTSLERNIRIASNLLILGLLLYLIFRLKPTLSRIILATTLVTPLTLLLRIPEVLLVNRLYLQGLLFSGKEDFFAFLTVGVPLLAISLALVDRLFLRRLGYRWAILPPMIATLVAMGVFGANPLELNSLPNIVGLWVVPLLYAASGPWVVPRLARRGGLDPAGVEEVFYAVFPLNAYTMSFFVSRVLVQEGFASWGQFNFVPIEILFAGLLFPWALFWALREGLPQGKVEGLVGMLLFYGSSFLLVSLAFILVPGVYPTWALQGGWQFPALFALLLYLLYGVAMPLLALRGPGYTPYLYAGFMLLLPTLTSRYVSRFLEVNTGNALVGVLSSLSISISFRLMDRMLKRSRLGKGLVGPSQARSRPASEG